MVASFKPRSPARDSTESLAIELGAGSWAGGSSAFRQSNGSRRSAGNEARSLETEVIPLTLDAGSCYALLMPVLVFCSGKALAPGEAIWGVIAGSASPIIRKLRFMVTVRTSKRHEAFERHADRSGGTAEWDGKEEERRSSHSLKIPDRDRANAESIEPKVNVVVPLVGAGRPEA